MRSQAYKEGYEATLRSAEGLIQTYPKCPYDCVQDFTAFLDWHIGIAAGDAELIIQMCDRSARATQA